MTLQQTVSKLLNREVSLEEAKEFANDQFGTLCAYIKRPPTRTLVLLLNDRDLLEKIENQEFESTKEMIQQLKDYGMTDEEEESLSYYELTVFMDYVNDQILDNLTDTFIGYVNIMQ